MDRQATEYTARLSAAAIDECSGRVRSFLAELGLPKRDILRYALTVEEILLDAADGTQEPSELCLRMGKRFARYYIDLEIKGAPHRHYAHGKDESVGVLGESLLRRLGLSPDYQYDNGCNCYSFTVKRQSRNPLLLVLIAVTAALLVSSLGFLLPGAARGFALEKLIVPLNDAFLSLMGGVAGPMIFLSVAWGIYGIGDVTSLKTVGKRLCYGFLGTFAVISALVCLLLLPAFTLRFTGAVGVGSSLIDVFLSLLALIPKDIFTPFIEGNTLQIIFLAIIFGVAMLFLGRKTDVVAKNIEQINYIVQLLIEVICKLVPAFIFTVLLKLMWSDMLGSLADVGKLAGVLTAAVLLASAALIGYTALKNKVSPLLLVTKGLPTLFIALSTASSAAAFGTNMEAARDRYGINEKLCSFGLPLGVVASKMNTALNYMLQSLFFAEMYALDISVPWIAIMLLTASLLSVATPPIPGGGLAAYAVLFTQLGIPAEALAIALTCETVFDFLVTGFDQFNIPFVLLNVAGKLGLVDRDKLLQK